MSPGFVKRRDKDCFNEARYFYYLDKPIGEDFIFFLKKFGEVKVFREFPVPFISMDEPKKLRLTAVMGEKRMNVVFKKDSADFSDEFEKGLDDFFKV